MWRLILLATMEVCAWGQEPAAHMTPEKGNAPAAQQKVEESPAAGIRTKAMERAIQRWKDQLNRKIREGAVPSGLPRTRILIAMPKQCAIPLLPVAPRVHVEPMPTSKPGEGRFAAMDVQVPAPSCDDVKK
jgi:hypothetical protein